MSRLIATGLPLPYCNLALRLQKNTAERGNIKAESKVETTTCNVKTTVAEWRASRRSFLLQMRVPLEILLTGTRRGSECLGPEKVHCWKWKEQPSLDRSPKILLGSPESAVDTQGWRYRCSVFDSFRQMPSFTSKRQVGSQGEQGLRDTPDVLASVGEIFSSESSVLY